MKKLLGISLLITIFCFAAPVYADGDMTTGNKNCTTNCGGFVATNPTIPDDKKTDESTIGNIYTWFYKQISEFIN